MQGKVIGIGGIFMKFENPAFMNKWYNEVLGLASNDYGVLFKYNTRTPKESGGASLQLGTFKKDSDYFGKDSQQYMINFRVDNLEAFLEKAKKLEVNIIDEIISYDYGSFLHIEDPEGNRIELWQPIDGTFDGEVFNEMF